MKDWAFVLRYVVFASTWVPGVEVRFLYVINGPESFKFVFRLIHWVVSNLNHMIQLLISLVRDAFSLKSVMTTFYLRACALCAYNNVEPSHRWCVLDAYRGPYSHLWYTRMDFHMLTDVVWALKQWKIRVKTQKSTANGCGYCTANDNWSSVLLLPSATSILNLWCANWSFSPRMQLNFNAFWMLERILLSDMPLLHHHESFRRWYELKTCDWAFVL